MSEQVWQKTSGLGKTEISTVTAGTPKRLFGTGLNGVTSGSYKDRQVIWLHNTDASNDLWYVVILATDGLPAALTLTTKHGRVAPGTSEPFTYDETMDVAIDASTGTIAYVAREEF